MNRLEEFRQIVLTYDLLHGDSDLPNSGSSPYLLRNSTGLEDPQSISSSIPVLDEMYKVHRETQEVIREIVQLTNDIYAKHNEKREAVEPNQCFVLRNDLELLTHRINERAAAVKKNLDSINLSIEKLKKNPEDASHNTSCIKIMENSHLFLGKTLADVMEKYHQIQLNVEKLYVQQTERRIKIKYTNLNGTTIDEKQVKVLAQKFWECGAENTIFQQQDDSNRQLLETRNDILLIEQSMTELNQIFKDLSLLIEEQGETLEQVSKNINSTLQYVKKSETELQSGKTYAKKTSKKMCCLVCLAVVLFLVMLAVILGYTL